MIITDILVSLKNSLNTIGRPLWVSPSASRVNLDSALSTSQVNLTWVGGPSVLGSTSNTAVVDLSSHGFVVYEIIQILESSDTVVLPVGQYQIIEIVSANTFRINCTYTEVETVGTIRISFPTSNIRNVSSFATVTNLAQISNNSSYCFLNDLEYELFGQAVRNQIT